MKKLMYAGMILEGSEEKRKSEREREESYAKARGKWRPTKIIIFPEFCTSCRVYISIYITVHIIIYYDNVIFIMCDLEHAERRGGNL